MKYYYRKLISVLLVLLMVLPLQTAVFAETAEQTDGEAAELSVATDAGEMQPTEEAAAGQTDDAGVIDADRLNQWAENFVQERGLDDTYQDFSIGFCYTGTGDSWYWNADVWMYSASLYKVPVSMLMAEKEAAGELTPESVVNGTTLEYLESTALVYSNNDSGHSMVSYLGGTYAGKCSDQTIKYTELPETYFNSDFIDVSYYTARYMTQVMKALYYGGSEQFPHVTDYLLTAQPDAYYRLYPDFSQLYRIAQKYGSYEEPNGNNNNHCAAIIYTPTPIVVVVMTRNVMDYQNLIAQVGMYLADYSLELDVKVEQLRTAAAEQAAREDEKAASAAAEAAAQENEAMTADTAAMETGVLTEVSAGDTVVGNTPADGTEGRFPLLPLICVLLAAALIAAFAIVIVSQRSHARENTPRRPTGKPQIEAREEKDSYRPKH